VLKTLLSVCTLVVGVVCGGGCGGVQRPDGGEGHLSKGSMVPDLKSPDQTGKVVALRDGVVSVVYFYPRDGTPGCTKEACAFRDVWDRYEAAQVRVIGVSADSDAKHRVFAGEHGLKFSLIADPGHVWSLAFGVKTMAGMDERVSFLVDTQGRIAKVYDDVDPGVHATEVLEDAAALSQGGKP